MNYPGFPFSRTFQDLNLRFNFQFLPGPKLFSRTFQGLKIQELWEPCIVHISLPTFEGDSKLVQETIPTSSEQKESSLTLVRDQQYHKTESSDVFHCCETELHRKYSCTK